MSMLVAIVDGFAGALFYLAAFLVVLTVVVFIHELGHFIVARWCGVAVEAFSIGFGKEIFGFNDKHGTRWKFSWIPLGGYVKFAGDENAASVPSKDALEQMSAEERAGAFQAKPVWQRALVVAAGPMANFLLAIVVFATMFMVYGDVKMEPRIAKVMPGTPAATAGFQAGDLVKSIDGREIDDFSKLQQYVGLSPGRTLTFVVDRGGVDRTLQVRPVMTEQNDRIAGAHKRPVIGIIADRRSAKITHERVDPVNAVALGAERTWTIITQTLSYIGDIFTLRQSADQLGGLIRIADTSGKVAELGPEYVIQFIAFVSVSIGLINLFPIPLLDGGHLVFYAYEAVRGRPLSERTQEIGFRIGFALVIALMVFATWNDRWIPARWLGLTKSPPATEQPAEKPGR